MSGSDFQIIPLHTIGRTILSLRLDHDHSDHQPEVVTAEIEAFQKQVSDLFASLSSPSSYDILSLPWLRSLLEIFALCQEDFRVLLLNNKSLLAKSSMEKMIDDFYDRSVKALDVCNAIMDGIEQIRQWQKLLEIVFNALDIDYNGEKSGQNSLGEGQIRRAKKALDDLVVGMSQEKGSNSSLGRIQSSKEAKSLTKSVSWIVSNSWSASRQLQAIGGNLCSPRGSDASTTNGLATSIYTMNSVLFIVMWSLVAAIPCQDRGIQSHLSISRQYSWAASILLIQDKIVEESKKKDRKNSCGLLKEIYSIEKWVTQMSELMDSLEFPIVGDKEEEIRNKVLEIRDVYETLKGKLGPLECQVRQVFHMIVTSRIQGLDCFARTCKHKKQTDFQGLD
ncbi:hypothetical protein V2J09_011228 [Rumex salicifolius]